MEKQLRRPLIEDRRGQHLSGIDNCQGFFAKGIHYIGDTGNFAAFLGKGKMSRRLMAPKGCG